MILTFFLVLLTECFILLEPEEMIVFSKQSTTLLQCFLQPSPCDQAVTFIFVTSELALKTCLFLAEVDICPTFVCKRQ